DAWAPLAVVPVEQATQTTEHRAFFATASTGFRRRCDDTIGQAAQGQRLKPDMTWPAQRGEKQTFTTKQGRLDLANVLDVELNGGLKGNDAAGVYPQHLARAELLFENRSARVDERPAVSLQALHDEAFSAEKSDAQLAIESDADAHAFGRAKERILLGDQFPAQLRQMDRDDLARIRRAEAYLFLTLPEILKDGHEQRFPGQQPFPGAHQAAQEPARAAGLMRTIAEDGLHLDALLHVHHPAGFSDDRFRWIQFHLHKLHVVAVDLVINFVHRVHSIWCVVRF